MTDGEYTAFLNALAGKHLRAILNRELDATYIQRELERLSSAARLLKVAGRSSDGALIQSLFDELGKYPVELAGRIMEESGILDALDDAPSLVFGQFRRSVIPAEDIELLRRAGYTDDEIEVFLAIAVERAHVIAAEAEHKARPNLPSEIFGRAEEAFARAAGILRGPKEPVQERKKRKILNGLGKILGGAIAGVGNVLFVVGTIAAPNPATAYGAIASGGLACLVCSLDWYLRVVGEDRFHKDL